MVTALKASGSMSMQNQRKLTKAAKQLESTSGLAERAAKEGIVSLTTIQERLREDPGLWYGWAKKGCEKPRG